MGYANHRTFKIGDFTYKAKKSRWAGPRQFNGRGEVVEFWYVKPTVVADSLDNWKPVGRTLAHLDRWIKRETTNYNDSLADPEKEKAVDELRRDWEELQTCTDPLSASTQSSIVGDLIVLGALRT